MAASVFGLLVRWTALNEFSIIVRDFAPSLSANIWLHRSKKRENNKKLIHNFDDKITPFQIPFLFRVSLTSYLSLRLYVDYEYHNLKAQFRIFNLTLPLKKWNVWRLEFLKTLHLVTIVISVIWRFQKYSDDTKINIFFECHHLFDNHPFNMKTNVLMKSYNENKTKS